MLFYVPLLHQIYHLIELSYAQRSLTYLSRKANISSYGAAGQIPSAFRVSTSVCQTPLSQRNLPSFDSPFQRASKPNAMPQGRVGQSARRPAFYVDGSDAYSNPSRKTEEPNKTSFQSGKKKASRIDAFKKAHAKDKAARAFDKQFGGVSTAPHSASGPRAALYKGQMGSKHKQAARMQKNGQESSFGGRIFGAFSFAGFSSSPKVIGIVAVCLCCVLSCYFLFPAAQQYYEELREFDRLEAEYAVLESRDQALEREVSALETDEGVAQQAHEEFGWVYPGEQTAYVSGLDLPQEDDSLEGFQANIMAESIDYPQTWYSSVLDDFFGIE